MPHGRDTPLRGLGAPGFWVNLRRCVRSARRAGARYGAARLLDHPGSGGAADPGSTAFGRALLALLAVARGRKARGVAGIPRLLGSGVEEVFAVGAQQFARRAVGFLHEM